MKLSKEEIEHLATLSRLELTAQEKLKYARQIGEVLSYVSKVQGWIKKSNRAVSNKVVSNKAISNRAISNKAISNRVISNKAISSREEGIEINELREDKVAESEVSSQELLKNAPELKDNFVKVPGILE